MKFKYLSYIPTDLLALRIININLIKNTITIQIHFINDSGRYSYILPNNCEHKSKNQDMSKKKHNR